MDYSKNATVAKIRAAYGKRLKNEDYKELAGFKNVSEAAEYLKKNTHYAQALSGINTSNIHRGFLEDVLEKSFFERYVKFCKFQSLEKKPFYKYLVIWLEIKEILSVILHLNAKSSDEYIVDLPSFLIDMASFDLIEMAKIRSFKQLLEVLRHTQYYQILKQIDVEKNGNVNFIKCEVMLRTHYLKWLIDTAEKNFSGDAGDNLKLQIQTQIDLINVINSYRMKNTFNVTSDKIKEHMLPFNGRLSMKKQNELFEAPSIEEFLRILSRTIYGRQLDNIAECENSIQFERELVKLRFDIAKRSLMFSNNAGLSLYSVTYLFEVELQNIIRIIEGIRYKKSIGYIESLLII